MAPSRKVSVQKKGQEAAQTPPATPRNVEQSKRSESPPDQPTAIRIRDEPPARSTRSFYTANSVLHPLPTPSQRIPIDCPVLRCRASTVHQHVPELQYFNPRPGRAAHHHGFLSSNLESPSRSSVVLNLRIGGGHQDNAQQEPEADKDEAAFHSDYSSEQVALIADNNKPPTQVAQQQTATFGETSDLQRGLTPEGPAMDSSPQDGQTALEQQQDTAPQGDEWNNAQIADELQRSQSSASSNLDHDRGSHEDPDTISQRLPEQNRDLIQDDSTSSTFQAPMTPPPSSPMAAEEEPSAQEMTGSPEQQEGQQSAASPAPQEFGDWLPGQGPENNPLDHLNPDSLTYEELIRPLVDPTLAPAPGMEGITEILRELQSSTDVPHRPSSDDGNEQQYGSGPNNDLADMLGITDFATFGGVSVDPPSSPHFPLSSDDGPLTLCNDPECPLDGEHPTGMYLHRGEMPHNFSGEFGYSDPPPEVWCAWARIGELRGREADFEMVNGFSKCHFWNGK